MNTLLSPATIPLSPIKEKKYPKYKILSEPFLWMTQKLVQDLGLHFLKTKFLLLYLLSHQSDFVKTSNLG